ncbi:DUF4054 domain-containing protein [Lacticaseibacillus saniviri]|uniref:Uncharacterized protein n=1 Tax=Lacticaseibacillus saniviri JCM 17471 = DSM 24301 TaxID=1293598 RepID=A0A0R2MQJ5_9LACO|nr:DUF4054 domain-containing protein [Lacticaseibacillus saniviri]KRO15896.1 hypothetical protein IV56_GL002086 [Lacticaseibacillus saniviri JCM 17471 = DSM 24301]
MDTFDGVVTRLKLIAPQITGIDDATLKIFATDAYAQAGKDGFSGDDIVRAASYLAAHYAFIAFNRNEHVKKEQAAVLSREYFDAGGKDAYIDEYLRMKAGLDDLAGKNVAMFY